MPLTVCCRLQWSERDDGRTHIVAAEFVGVGITPPIGSLQNMQEAPVVHSVLPQHRHGRVPFLFHLDLVPVIRK